MLYVVKCFFVGIVCIHKNDKVNLESVILDPWPRSMLHMSCILVLSFT